jgi:UDP-N-acetylglucosamine pyrophosphorylase
MRLKESNFSNFSSSIYLEQLAFLKKAQSDTNPVVSPVQAVDFYETLPFEQPFGIVILAGGQGSRLGFPHPKGCFLLSETETLFSVLLKKMTNPFGYFAIMTSKENIDETKAFFYQHQFFGKDPQKIDFFVQESWPVLDENHNWVLHDDGEIFSAPLGNGSFYAAFTASPIYQKWKELNIEFVNILPVDNFLADPQDPQLLYALQNGFDLAVRGIRKESKENVGMLVLADEKISVIEYSELKEEIETLAYSGLFGITMELIEKASKQLLPLHLAKKRGKVRIAQEEKEVSLIKFEKFIFDAFPLANQFVVLNTCRKKYFCPLKDKLGPYGIESVREKFRQVNV